MGSGKRSNTKLIVIISSMVSLTLILMVAFNANWYISRISDNNTRLYSAFRISELMKLFRANILVLETKQRAYIVTGDPKFLEEYRAKELEAKTHLKSMEKYFSGKPEEESFYHLKELTYRKLMEGKDLSYMHSAEGPEQQDTGPEKAISTMDEINVVVSNINESLGATTKMLLDNSIDYVNSSKKWEYAEIAIGIITACMIVIILFRDINVRNKLQQELKDAKARADQNALMKEQFMANMSHEIRTPMNAIVGFSDLLKKTELNDIQQQYLSAIKTSGSNLLNIINDILDFSKIEAGKLHIEKITFNMLELLHSMKQMFYEKANEKGIGLKVNADPNIPELVFGDPMRLTQILVNLLGNAIKFTQQGSVILSCEIKSIEHEMVQFVFRIKDSGIGIPPDKLSDIFDRFNQGNSATTRNFGGTGLGLSIVKNLVEIQNGNISVKSKEGAGTEFMVSLSYPVSYENITKIPEETEGLKINASKPLTALVVEDNVFNQKLATTYLEQFGLKAELAENGEIAVQKIKNNDYDLVLMDIQMPVMDGYTAVKLIREAGYHTIPIIAMTAHTMESEREKCLSMGMNDYISKPFSEQMLFNVIRQAIGGHQTSQPLTQPLPSLHSHKDAMVNLEQIFSLSRGNNDFIKEMISIFLEDNPQEMQQMQNHINNYDFGAIRSLAHKMKTSIGFLGIDSLLPPLTAIESIFTETKNMEGIISEFNKIKQGCELAIMELKQVLASLKSA